MALICCIPYQTYFQEQKISTNQKNLFYLPNILSFKDNLLVCTQYDLTRVEFFINIFHYITNPQKAIGFMM